MNCMQGFPGAGALGRGERTAGGHVSNIVCFHDVVNLLITGLIEGSGG
jgi:hypothetical protein